MKRTQYFIFGFTIILLLSFLCNGQEKIRKIEKRSIKNEPIELVSARVGSKAFTKENQILADKDWLKNLEFDLKNISGKTIVYAEVQIEVGRQGKMQYPLLLPLIFGQIPQSESQSLSTYTAVESLKVLKPNDSVKISIEPSTLEKFTTIFMPQNEITEIEQVRFYFDFIIFDDGLAWSRGRLMRRNSSNKWQDIRAIPIKTGVFNSHFNLNTAQMFINSWRKDKPKSCSAVSSSFFL